MPVSIAIHIGVKTTLGTPVAVVILTFWPAGMLGIAAPEAAGLALAGADAGAEAAGLALPLAAPEAAGLALAAADAGAEAAGLEADVLGADEGLAVEGLVAGAAAPPPHAASKHASASGGTNREYVFIPFDFPMGSADAVVRA
jgi:hypothetical protein